MRLITAFVFFLLISFSSSAQDSNIVTWNVSAVKTGTGQYDIILKGQVKTGWHLYAKSDAVGLAGLVVNARDESVKADTISFISSFENYTDPIFDNASQKVARGTI